MSNCGWVNHPQFDISRLQTLFEPYGEWPLWEDFHAEADVSSLKKCGRMAARLKGSIKDPFGAESVPETISAPSSHTALGDCYYNLWVLGRSGYGFDTSSKVIDLDI